jgi:cytosine/adenosine deaminase-related metal-dependent hydrolase
MRAVASLQHALSYEKQHAGTDPASERITPYDVLSYATIEGAKANGLADKTGSLTPGKEADVILLRTDKPNVFPVNDPVGAVVWSMDTSNVDSVFVAGKPMKRNGKLLHVDWDAVKKVVNESRDYVIKKSGFRLQKI